MTRRMHRRDVTARLLTASVLLVMLVSFVGFGYASPGKDSRHQSSESTGTVPGDWDESDSSNDGGDGDKKGSQNDDPAAEQPPVVEEPVAEAPPAEDPPAGEPVAPAPAPAEEIARTEKSGVVSTDVVMTTGQGVTPVYVSGNPLPCNDRWLKIDRTPTDGVYDGDESGVVTSVTKLPAGASIEVSNVTDGKYFDFTATGIKITAVVVKASNGANIYYYDPAVGWDTGLWTVLPHTISHVTFCWEPADPGQAHILIRKFNDRDGNGFREGTEPWMADFTFKLERGASETGPWTFVAEKTTTVPNGMADFGMQPFGWYRVTEYAKNGWTPTTPPQKIFFHTGEVNGQAETEEHWFGNQAVWKKTFDLNWEGTIPDADNTTFYVTYNVDGTPADPLQLTQAGFKNSVHYPNGTVISKVGWWAKWEYAPGEFKDILLGTTRGETLEADKVNSFTFGSELKGYKYEDLDADGEKDLDEPTLQGWVIVLEMEVSDGVWVEVGRRTTDSNGYYRFYSLLPGSYRVSEDMSALTPPMDAWTWTQSFPAGDYHTCTIEPRMLAGDLSVDCVGTRCRKDFLNWAPASLEGVKFNDLDNDGVRDAGEPGLAGWVIYVDYNGNNRFDDGEPWDTSDDDGKYFIDGIKPGTYDVLEVQVAPWQQSLGGYNITFQSRGHYGIEPRYDFGNYQVFYEIEGWKYEDMNADGSFAGDPALSGWLIYLDIDEDGVYDAGEPSDTTDANGHWKIGGLTAGEYDLRENISSQPGDWTQSYPGGDHLGIQVGPDAQTRVFNFANWEPAEIHGKKYHDLMADESTEGDPGLSGWMIFVDYDGNGMPGSEEPTSATDGAGDYHITGVEPGQYWVREVMKADWTQSRGDYLVTFESGGIYGLQGEYDFANWTTTGFHGYKFHDKDANGAWDGIDYGMAGWEIHAIGNTSQGIVVTSTVTGPGGYYEFNDLPPGSYTVTETLKPEWNQSYPVGTDAHTVGLKSGMHPETSYDFGNWQYTDPFGYKYEDLDADGTHDTGEPPVGDVAISLDGTTHAGVPVHMTTSTNDDGYYFFDKVPPGNYDITETLTGNWVRSYPADPGAHSVSLYSGDAPAGPYDFLNWKPGEKYGMKFEDMNGDGVKDDGDDGLEGWIIYVDYNDNSEYDDGEPFAITGTGGFYEIKDVKPGTWMVREVMKSDFEWTQSKPGGPLFGYLEEFTSGVVFEENDFGNWAPAEISGKKFEDLNNNGENDGEPGLGGVRIYVDYNHSDTYDAGEPTTLTAADGSYKITGIEPGEFEVREVVEAGWNQSVGNYVVEFESRGVYGPEEYEFGNWTPGDKSGMKFEDLNANGVKDPGEPGLSGWTIFVDYNDNGMLDDNEPSAITTPSGGYMIEGIEPGSYWVYEVMKTDYDWTQSFPGEPDFGYYETFTSASSMVDNDFGNWAPASITGKKVEDLDGDGILEPDEPGLSGWTIFVDYDGDGVPGSDEPSDTTDGDGVYEITGVKPGTYDVLEVLQTDWTQTRGSFSVEFESRGEYGIESDDYTFLNYEFIDLNGYKFHDLDADGIWAQAESGLEGWQVTLKGTAGDGSSVEMTATTDDTGYYEFLNLKPGEYTIAEVMQADWTQSYPESGDYDVVLQSGETPEMSFDFGNWTYGEAFGTKFFDVDGDGEAREEGEEGLSGWTFFVDYDDDGELDADEPSAVSDEDGNYHITMIEPGTWTIREVEGDETWKMTFPADGSYSETFVSQSEIDGLDFGNTTLVEKMFELTFTNAPTEDADYFVTYEVDGEPMNTALEASTTAGVYFTTSDVFPQTVITNVEWFATWRSEDIKLGDGADEEVVVEDMKNVFEYDAAIFGHKWNDTDFETGTGDGVWDTDNEDPIEDWTIELYRQNTSGGWDLWGSMLTDEDGAYGFDSVLPGTYYLAEVIPDPEPGFVPWTQTAGPNGVGDLQFVVENGSVAGPVDFGNVGGFLTLVDMGITKTASPNIVKAGGIVTYTLTYTLVDGELSAGDLFTVTDDYDEQYFTVVDAAGGTVSNGTITWSLEGPMEKGDSGTIAIQLRLAEIDDIPGDVTEFDNVAIIDKTDDYDPTNNRDTALVERPKLPFTGGDAMKLAMVAAMLMLAGLTLRRFSRQGLAA